MTGAVDGRLEGLIARARAFDGHPPFSDGALAELASGKREVLWLEGDVGAAVRTVAGASVTEAEFVIDPDARQTSTERSQIRAVVIQSLRSLIRPGTSPSDIIIALPAE